ncbi:MAG: dockerin type I domain-containing protein [Planctomycetota bacterium]
MLCILLLFVSSAIASDDEVLFIRGDVNNDGAVSIADLIYVIHYVVGGWNPSSLHCDSMDVNDDGAIDIADPAKLLTFLFMPGANETLPAPYPDPGEDPTLDEFDCDRSSQENPTGSDIQHIYFLLEGAGSPGIAVFPGQQGVEIPIFLNSNQRLHGYTLSLHVPVSAFPNATLTFQGSVGDCAELPIPSARDADGFIYGYVLPDFLSYDGELITSGEELPLAFLHVDVSPALEPGSSITISLTPIPQQNDRPQINNETVIEGGFSFFPQEHGLELPVVTKEELFLRCDANRSGNVDIADALHILSYLFAGDPPAVTCLDALDVDDSGELNLADAIYIFERLFQGGAAPADPFPHFGIDPTHDHLDCN